MGGWVPLRLAGRVGGWVGGSLPDWESILDPRHVGPEKIQRSGECKSIARQLPPSKELLAPAADLPFREPDL